MTNRYIYDVVKSFNAQAYLRFERIMDSFEMFPRMVSILASVCICLRSRALLRGVYSARIGQMQITNGNVCLSIEYRYICVSSLFVCWLVFFFISS